jgi:hypothetical protein
MDKLIKEISSPYWWIGVVIVGIAINITSVYVSKIMESSFSGFSIYWKNKQKERADKTEKMIEILKNNSELRIIFALREFRFRLHAISFILFGSVFLSLGFITKLSMPMEPVMGFLGLLGAILGLLAILIAMAAHRGAMKIHKLLESSIEEIYELNK